MISASAGRSLSMTLNIERPGTPLRVEGISIGEKLVAKERSTLPFWVAVMSR